MLSIVRTMKNAAERRSRYRQIRDEIAGLSPRESLDLGIFPQDAPRIAWEAVYGQG